MTRPLDREHARVRQRYDADQARHEVWTMEERGWWTSPGGGVCQERDGWHAYPIAGGNLGPFRTMSEAQAAIDKPRQRGGRRK